MKSHSSACLIALAFLLATAGESRAQSGDTSSEPLKAIAVLRPTEGNKVSGLVVFTEVADGVRVEADITGLTPGKHGFHVHEFGDCSAADGSAAGASAAGDHFNPAKKPHGPPDEAERHAGDMGNIEVTASGSAKLNYVDHTLSLVDGEKSIIGRSVIVHAKKDDLKSQLSGESGERVSCGVIGRVRNK